MHRKYGRAAKAVVCSGNKILLIHRAVDDGNRWDLPGGEVDDHEDFQQGLRREVMEETGLDVTIIDSSRPAPYRCRGRMVMEYVYRCVPTNPQPEVHLSEEHDELVWIKREHLRDYQVPFFIERAIKAVYP
jgi:8-oxo-dGTP pyrophosphatase MutT (NUDIX family)